MSPGAATDHPSRILPLPFGEKPASPKASVAALYASYQGEGPLAGERHLFLRFVCCNLRCNYCDAPETLAPKTSLDVGHPVFRQHPNPVPLPILLKEITQLHRQSGARVLAVTGGEPLLHEKFLSALLPQAKHLGLDVLLETNALLPEAFHTIAPFVDVLSADVKLQSVDQDKHAPDWRRQQLAATLDQLLPTQQAYLKVVVGPGLDLTELQETARLIMARHAHLPWFVQPVTLAGHPWQDPLVTETAKRLSGLGLSATVCPQLHVLAGLP